MLKIPFYEQFETKTDTKLINSELSSMLDGSKSPGKEVVSGPDIRHQKSLFLNQNVSVLEFESESQSKTVKNISHQTDESMPFLAFKSISSFITG